MEQKHFGGGDNVSGNKEVNNNILINLKWWILIIVSLIIAVSIYFSRDMEIVGIKGNNNSGNNVEINPEK